MFVVSESCQNLTEFNTAHNKRISLLTIEEGNLEIQRPKRKRRNSRVTFSEEDSIINPGTYQCKIKNFIYELLVFNHSCFHLLRQDEYFFGRFPVD